MNKSYVFLLFLCSYCLVSCGKILNVQVEYDSDLDLIMKDGQLYARLGSGAMKDRRMLNDLNDQNELNGETHSPIEEKEKFECEEELVEGSELWFFILIILCKLNL